MTSSTPAPRAVSPTPSGISTADSASATADQPTLEMAPNDASSVPPPSEPPAGSSTEDAAPDSESTAPEQPDDDADELPTLDPAALAHFAAIQSALTFQEGMLARAMAAELTPAELRTWLADLRELSVPDAVAKIRAVLNAGGSDSASGGGS